MSDPTTTPPAENQPQGIEHDPYEWGQCAITASIVWLPDGTVMLGARNHLDAPIITLLQESCLTRLPGHAAELPIPTAETIADLLTQLREDLPLRARAKADREQAAQRKAEEVKGKSKKKAAPANPPPAVEPPPMPTTVTLAQKAPAATQVSLFNLMTGG